MAGVWTLNWKATKNALLCGDWIENLSTLKATSGAYYTSVSASQSRHDMTQYWSALGYLGGTGSILLGSGSTAPAESDYALETPLSGYNVLSVVEEKPVWDTTTGVVSNTVKMTVQNRNAEAITVREWGMLRPFVYPGSSNTHFFLLYRAVLDSPVTIQPNQSAMLTLTRSVTLTDPVVWPV